LVARHAGWLTAHLTIDAKADRVLAPVGQNRMTPSTVSQNRPHHEDGHEPGCGGVRKRARPDEGTSVPELMSFTGMGRTWVYDRLQDHAATGRAVQISRGRWRVTPQ
jgi:hypothetical protein